MVLIDYDNYIYTTVYLVALFTVHNDSDNPNNYSQHHQ